MAGILICGLNGAGKSTLGKALAKALNSRFIDSEDLYFPRTDPRDAYAAPWTRDEVEQLLLREIDAHPHFVFASVKGDYGDEILARFQYAILVDVPKELRMRRVRDRSFRAFGNRMLPGGDLYEREERFFAAVQSRADDMVEAWAQTLRCPVIRVDGTRPVEESVTAILRQLEK